MNTSDPLRFDFLYQQHLTNLTLQGIRQATIYAYSRAVRRITDLLDKADLKLYFASLYHAH